MNAAAALYILLGVLGLSLFVAGAFVLFGLGWALMAGACASFAGAGFIRKGMTGE